jgi:hypothetical protein
MSEHNIVGFTCGCGRDGFIVVDRNPPIPGEYIAVYDKDHEGLESSECRECGTPIPKFSVRAIGGYPRIDEHYITLKLLERMERTVTTSEYDGHELHEALRKTIAFVRSAWTHSRKEDA